MSERVVGVIGAGPCGLPSCKALAEFGFAYECLEASDRIGGVWTETEWVVGGHSVTLDNLEHNLLRPFFRDPRIHFAVNCASHSCAPLPTWAFTGEQLEAQLDERTRAFLQDEANVAIEGSTLRVSRYFEWYGDDFWVQQMCQDLDTIDQPRTATVEIGVAINRVNAIVPNRG